MTSMNIDEFCRAHSISRAFFYKLMQSGRGPRVFKLGRTTRITEEANREWVAAHEAQAVAA